jgi:hypothetical protein
VYPKLTLLSKKSLDLSDVICTSIILAPKMAAVSGAVISQQ